MTKEELKTILPHREPMLLLDEADQTGENSAEGHYTVRGDEWFLKGHFPGYPIVPGVIQCEMLAQTCCLPLKEQLKGKTPLYAGMNKVRFHGQVRPGDTLILKCEITKSRPPFYFASGKGYIKDKMVVSGEFSFAVSEK